MKPPGRTTVFKWRSNSGNLTACFTKDGARPRPPLAALDKFIKPKNSSRKAVRRRVVGGGRGPPRLGWWKHHRRCPARPRSVPFSRRASSMRSCLEFDLWQHGTHFDGCDLLVTDEGDFTWLDPYGTNDAEFMRADGPSEDEAVESAHFSAASPCATSREGVSPPESPPSPSRWG